MKKIYVLFLVLALTGLVAMAKDVNVSGDWTLTLTTPRGEMTSEVIFVQDGEHLKVTMKNPRGESTGEGTIKGSDIEWSITRDTPRGQFTTTYKGKIQDENNMSGEAEMGNFGTASWKATRKTA
ncbi:MAG: hypothetical protein ACPLZD_07240 [Candidatus Saccharicenans sp.]|nr:MAG: hypothetical protein C0168_08390 [Candidatus Aminicenantes bacterium]HEK86348.1 hypothetical protein [Candidatus Aminicenantes bacterium]